LSIIFCNEGGLECGLGKKSSHEKKSMHFKELKTLLHHIRRGVISLSEFNKRKWKTD
jgi:hypothetical protein